MNVKQQPPERPRGRPADTEAGELQSRLLDVAEELFAEYGYAATSIRQLAAAAGVNPALVHYYFGTKRELLEVSDPRYTEIACKRDDTPDQYETRQGERFGSNQQERDDAGQKQADREPRECTGEARGAPAPPGVTGAVAADVGS